MCARWTCTFCLIGQTCDRCVKKDLRSSSEAEDEGQEGPHFETQQDDNAETKADEEQLEQETQVGNTTDLGGD